MGEIAEMMLDGDMCQYCGVWVGGGDGYPQSCAGCADDDQPDYIDPRIKPKFHEVDLADMTKWRLAKSGNIVTEGDIAVVKIVGAKAVKKQIANEIMKALRHAGLT